MICTRVGTTVT